MTTILARDRCSGGKLSQYPGGVAMQRGSLAHAALSSPPSRVRTGNNPPDPNLNRSHGLRMQNTAQSHTLQGLTAM